MENINKVIDEFLKEIETGRVETKNNVYNIKIYVNEQKEDELIPVLKIRNREIFDNKIQKYINKLIMFTEQQIIDDDFVKDALAHLFANVTFKDFEEPERFVEKHISFMDKPNLDIDEVDGLFDDVVSDNDIAFNSTLCSSIERQSVFQETPYAFKTFIKKQIDNRMLEYQLPNISFGIYNGTCYIYAIQNGKRTVQENEDMLYSKKIKRLLYKLDDKVKENETNEYIDYKNGVSDYYPENISDVVPSVVLALSFFLITLFKNDITKVKVVSFLPVRYNAKRMAFNYIVESKSRKNNFTRLETMMLLKQYIKEHQRIQDNLTQKLLRNFNRLKFHFNNIGFESYPFENGEYLSIKLSSFEKTNNCILERLIKQDSKRLK